MISDNAGQAKKYFERADQLFNSIYTGEKSAFSRWLDNTLRADIQLRFVMTLEEIQKRKPDSILDIGVGPGQYLEAYIQLGIPDISALDFSHSMLDLAKMRVGPVPSNIKLKFIAADFMRAEFDRKYDLTVAMGVFDYVAEPEKFLGKMKALSSRAALVSFPAVNPIRTPIRKFRYFFKRCPVYFYTRKKIELLAEACGFKSWRILKFRRGARDFWVKFEC